MQLPASLNFFQLHRVVCQTMNCGAEGTRETHEWSVPNLASRHDYSVTNAECCESMSIGQSYFVENRERVLDWYGMTSFEKGVAIRQRISCTGAYIDSELPLFQERNLHLVLKNGAKMQACIHSTCISSVFYQMGTAAVLSLGLAKYCTK